MKTILVSQAEMRRALGAEPRARAKHNNRRKDLPVSALTITVPVLPPTVNHMYEPNGRGGRLLSNQAIAFRQLAGYEAKQTAALTGWQLPAGALKLTILLTFGNRLRADIDNRAKAALDALALSLGFDDSRIDEITVRRVGFDRGRPHCEMILEAL